VGGIKVGVGPDLFTHGLGCGINFGPLCALAACRAFVNTRAPVPSLVPVTLASEIILAVLPPFVAVFLTQRHIQDSLLTPALICFLYPGSQVWRALIEASVLDEVFFALGAHNAAVIPVKFVQVGVIVVGFCAGVCCATCIVTPGSTLTVKLSLSARLHFVVCAVHTHVEFVQRQSATEEGKQQDQGNPHGSAAGWHQARMKGTRDKEATIWSGDKKLQSSCFQ